VPSCSLKRRGLHRTAMVGFVPVCRYKAGLMGQVNGRKHFSGGSDGKGEERTCRGLTERD
jgi:hypothetical protein